MNSNTEIEKRKITGNMEEGYPGSDGKQALERRAMIAVAFLYSTAEEGHCDLAEIFIFVLFHLYMS